ncbi:MAG: hypothetical protein NPIRA06_00170 [Nitrospirales bacterium]|nr:MAG: hypothetical protein NPIRA06_00170 [Nitrospirales bacterium]
MLLRINEKHLFLNCKNDGGRLEIAGESSIALNKNELPVLRQMMPWAMGFHAAGSVYEVCH